MKSILAIAACLLICQGSQAQEYKSNRPAPEKRCFSSEAVERTIAELSSKLANPKLAWMFSNCFPNTIDTTVEYDEQAVRQMIECIRAYPDGKLEIIFGGGYTIMEHIQ